jgi:Crp-like helix-turn-helix domain
MIPTGCSHNMGPEEPRQITEKSERLRSRSSRGYSLLRSKRSREGHRHVWAWQGSGRRDTQRRTIFWWGLSEPPIPANGFDERDDRLPDNLYYKSVTITAIHDQTKFSSLFMDHLLSRNSRIEADVIDQLFNSSEKRLARLLLLLANYGKEGSPPIAPVTVSQETLAAMIGTTRSRLSHFMNKFRKSGFIDYNGKIDVHQSLLNSLLHDKPRIREDEPA